MAWQARAAAGAALVLAFAAPAFAQAPAIPIAQEFERLHFRSIGPATMSGRISDVAVYEANPALYYVGTAHGGVWKTVNHGTTWEPLFQNEGLISIGDVAVSQRNPDLVWAGAGESNNRQSTSWGGGIYKSTDGGKTFQHMGLANSRHINNIVIDPANDDIVMVAATGPLFGPGGDRGIYRTTDGGRTWRLVLSVDAETGANELTQSLSDPRVLFASTYQRRRQAYGMSGGGPGSGIWKSTDRGETWTRLSGNGLPDGPLGRIALDIYAQDANLVYASIEGQSGQGSATGVYRSTNGGASWERLSTGNPRPMYFSKIRIDPTTSDRIYMAGVGLWMSLDGGRTFEQDAAMVTHDDVHAIWINPVNPSHIVVGNDGGMAVSWDLSRTWQFIPNLPVGLFYHVSYDMERPFNVCGGMQDNYNWCGPSASRHRSGIMNHDWFQILGGDGFHAIPDPRDSRIIYTESQNGNMIRRDKVTGESKSIRPAALNVVNAAEGEAYRWNWDTPMLLSPHDPGIMFVAAQRVFRSTDRGDSWTAISGDLSSNADRNEFMMMGVRNADVRIARNDGVSSWPTIVSLAESPAQAGVLYTGTDDGLVHVTRDGGATWENVTSRMAGFPERGYVSEVVPSRFAAGTVYVTVDNHLANDYASYIWASDDFGRTFRSIVANLRGENVRTLTEDTRNRDVLYIGTETGIFVTLDRGRSWRRLQSNLPTVRVDEITIHPRDNAMIVATHGRALFILDQLSPIQELAAAQQAAAALFTPNETLQWRSKDDRNEEFWGHQWFVGENPPFDAVLQYHLRQPANDVRLVITDAAGRRVRELSAPADRRSAGIQTVCWDQRVEPIPAAAGGGAGGPGGGGGGGGGQAGQNRPIPGLPTPLPEPGYRPRNICASETPAQGGGAGGGANAGPYVVPGQYTVTLMVDGREAGRKPLSLVMDPEVRLAGQDRVRHNTLAETLHEAQRQGATRAAALTALGREIGAVTARLDSVTAVPADVRAQFQALAAEFDSVRVKFGVAAAAAPGAQAGGPGGGGGGGGGGFGGAANNANALGRVSGAKTTLIGVWEMPSEAVVRQAAEAQAALSAANAEADALLRRVPAVSQALGRSGITLTVPPAGS
jgi:photosystem II stability/assembly factor-like uncharacterized protein